MAFVFGGSVDNLASQRLATDQVNIGLAESNRRAQQQAIDTYNQQQIAAQRQQQEDQRQAAAQQFQFADLAARNQQQQASAQTQAFQFGQEESDKKASRDQSQKQFDASQTQADKQFQFTQDQAKVNTAAKQLQDYIGMLNKGTVPEDADIGKLFPDLSPGQVSEAKRISDQQKAFDDQQLQSIAAQATHLARATGNVAAAVPDTTGFFSRSNAKPAVTITADQAFKHIMADEKLRDASDRLNWDDATQQFVPKLRNPQIAPAPPASPPVPLPAGGAAPLSPAVTAAAQPGFNFAMPQTDAAPMPAPTVTPFGNRGATIQTNAPVTPMMNGQVRLPTFGSADEVKAAYQSGKISRQMAAQVLAQQFGMAQ